MKHDEIVEALKDVASWYGKHGRNTNTAVIDIATEAANMIESLQEQLSESQRREHAAVDDLYTACTRSPCNSGICVKKDCTGNIIPCEFEWRGSQNNPS